MAILEQIVEPQVGNPGWNTKFKLVLDRVNLMPEIVLDVLASKLIAGAGITTNYNSATKALTINSTGATGFDPETLMDHLAAHLVPGIGVSLTYDDAAGNITLASSGSGGGGGGGPALPRVVALTDAATITPNADTTDVFKVTIAGNRLFAAPSGTPIPGQKLIGRIKQDGTGSRVPTWNAIYRFPGGSAPVLTTTASKTDYIGFIYNADDSKWDNIALAKNL